MNSSINFTEKEQNSFLLLADNSFYEKNSFCLMRREQRKSVPTERCLHCSFNLLSENKKASRCKSGGIDKI